MPFEVIIPSRDEAQTIAAVVRAARAARDVGRVVVVDDQSADATAVIARDAGAEVIRSRGHGSKALALATGVDATSNSALVFFDADITGATPFHSSSWPPRSIRFRHRQARCHPRTARAPRDDAGVAALPDIRPAVDVC